MGRRLGAHIVDTVILVVLATPVVPFLEFVLDVDTEPGSLRSYFLTLILRVVYEPVMTAWKGATFGKLLVRIRVVDKEHGEPVTVDPAFGRYAVKEVLNIALLILPILFVLWILWALSPFFDSSGYRQGWHDKMAGTRVVEA
ncbi:RDD family protein [Streptosporangium amethystogenes subsp. fukuiense]|uniref:RDD family protein n=2 Tax=Streptosporangium amethystogenes TaxID=2002 RepID=A0ABW2THK2_9ACTN